MKILYRFAWYLVVIAPSISLASDQITGQLRQKFLDVSQGRQSAKAFVDECETRRKSNQQFIERDVTIIDSILSMLVSDTPSSESTTQSRPGLLVSLFEQLLQEWPTKLKTVKEDLNALGQTLDQQSCLLVEMIQSLENLEKGGLNGAVLRRLDELKELIQQDTRSVKHLIGALGVPKQ